ncbi:branched-chain amino acid ABC transporter permease [Spirillospora sp. CA-108201]
MNASTSLTSPSTAPSSGPRPSARWRPQPRRLVAVLLFAVMAVYAVFVADEFGQYQASLIVVYAIAALGQDRLMGRAGQVSLGAAAFMAVGAYVTARLSETSWAVFPVPILLSAMAGGAIGLIVGVTGLRFRGLYLALSTLALQFVVGFAAKKYQGNNEAGLFTEIPHLGGISLEPGRNLVALLVVVLAVLALALGGLYRRAPGRAWAAIRQNEGAAAVAGIDVRRWKLLAFVGSSAVIAVSGSLYAYVLGVVNYVPFSLDLAVSILVIVFVGGLGTISGTVIGAAFVVLLPHWLQTLPGQVGGGGSFGTWLNDHSPELAVAVYGLALVLVLLFERDGVVGLVRRGVDAAANAASRRRAARPASTEEKAR